jgi:hypothetical protein
MTSSAVVRRRIRRLRTSKRNGKARVSLQICTPVPRGKEASSRRDLLLQSRPLLPSQRYLLLHQHQRASQPSPQSLQLLLPIAHQLLPQPWQLSLQINRTNPLCLVHLVCFVDLVDLVQLVSFIQPNKPDKPNERDRLVGYSERLGWCPSGGRPASLLCFRP